jgi:NAD(P)H dehydrogenase (quinone)
MIAITGANGHLGRATLTQLLRRTEAHALIATARDPGKATERVPTGVAVRRADYSDYESMLAAFGGAEVLLLISGDAPVPVRIAQHRNAIDAARAAGVRHVVYTGIIDPDPESPFTFAAIHADTEAYLKASGLSYTVFRNGLYLEALPMMIGNPSESGQLFFPGGEGKISFAARSDIAEALANVLTQPAAHRDQTYTITLPQAYSFAEIAAMLGQTGGVPVRYADIPAEALESELRKHQLPDFMVEAMTGMARAVAAGRFNHPSPTLTRLLGRVPLGLADFLGETYGTNGDRRREEGRPEEGSETELRQGVGRS